ARARTSVAPAFNGHVMTVADVRTRRASVRRWQQQMTRRGYPLVADGLFGRRSSAAAAAFARAKRVRVTPGTVNAALWTATWTAR
nr:transglycosylase [Actinomycetota bacterium]